ncbi:hypothetical protein Syun_016105 [Stephania yunnanensis]|uniref:Uncharacterized protein n=1 Tax=Stephania yunnanensis TaxID=152371 RepID=A0AAP0J6J3_9MAGN
MVDWLLIYLEMFELEHIFRFECFFFFGHKIVLAKCSNYKITNLQGIQSVHNTELQEI